MLATLAESQPGAERKALVQKLATAFEAHASFEEKAIYPLVPAVMGAEEEQEAEIEHRLAREGVEKLVDMVSQPGFGVVVEMLQGGIGHHVRDEEGEMFPALRKATDAATKQQLMEKLRKAKAAAGLPLMDPEVATKQELLSAAADAGISGRSSMSKEQLADAITRPGR